MTQDQPARTSRVPGFVYLDMDRVRSISSRLDEGYIENRIQEQEKTDEIASSIFGSIKAQILGSIGPTAEAGAEVTASHSTGQRLQENKALHHYYYDILEDWLEQFEGDWFHNVDSLSDKTGGESALPSRFRSTVEEGDIIKSTGEVEILDFRSSVELMAGFFDALDLLEEVQTNTIQEALRGNSIDELDIDEFGFAYSEFESVEPLFEMFTNVMPDEYTEMVAAECKPVDGNDEFTFWALVDRGKLERPPVELLSKYQSNSIPNCTLLARIDTITNEPEASEMAAGSVDTEDDLEFGKMLHIADDLATEFGFKVEYPKISVSPIAIYR